MAKLPKALFQGELKIGEITIPCAHLEDDTRVLRERSVAKILGKKGSGAHWKKKKEGKGAVLPEYVSAGFLDPFIDDELRSKLLEPINYITMSDTEAQGMDATLLPQICDVWLKAREKGALSKAQEFTAKQAEILMRGFAHLGIIALVDEATGYQKVRARRALEEILEKFIAKELQKWIKTFPDDFYEEMFKLKGWPYDPSTVRRPSVIGKYTNDIIYDRLAPAVRQELEKLNPKNPKGFRRYRHHQWLTADIGHPRLKEHISAVIALMKASTNWDQFQRLLKRAFPRYGENLELPLDS